MEDSIIWYLLKFMETNILYILQKYLNLVFFSKIILRKN